MSEVAEMTTREKVAVCIETPGRFRLCLDYEIRGAGVTNMQLVPERWFGENGFIAYCSLVQGKRVFYLNRCSRVEVVNE